MEREARDWIRRVAENADAGLRVSVGMARGLQWAGGVCGVTSAASAATDATGMALGCVPGAGLFFQVVSLGIQCASNISEAVGDNMRLSKLRRQLELLSQRGAKVADVIFKSGRSALGEEDGDRYWHELFGALVRCRDFLAEVERHKMKKLFVRAAQVEVVARPMVEAVVHDLFTSGQLPAARHVRASH